MASKRPRSLIDMWAAAASAKRPALDNAIEADHAGSISSEDEGSPDLQSDLDTSKPVSDLISLDSASTSQSVCTSVCCSDKALKPFQPTSRMLNGRNFVAEWFEQYPWLTVCLTKRKIFCFECRFDSKHELLTFSHNCSPAFTDDGFNNWKKAIEKFNSHEASHTHREATMKRLALGQPTLSEKFNTQMRCAQESRRKPLLTQLSSLRYLLRQGLAIRGHNDDQQGNLKQLLVMMATDSNPCVKDWIRENKYMSPEIVNEQTTIMGLCVTYTFE